MSRLIIKKMPDENDISVILPARNEAESLELLLPRIREQLPEAEIIVVNDGSTDNTQSISDQYADIVVQHRHSLGNGAAIKAGARESGRKYLLFMDADGQHNPDDIPSLIKAASEGHTMVVGARNPTSHASIGRRIANAIYNKIATYMTNQPIHDLTSGFRIVDAKLFKQFIYLLPNGFSYPTTITIALSRIGKSVYYVPIHAGSRTGNSHINPITDGIRFLIIIFKIGSLYSPLKLFAPASLLLFLSAIAYYGHTYLIDGRFTNMGVLLFLTSILTFMLGILSEQITTLMYSQLKSHEND